MRSISLAVLLGAAACVCASQAATAQPNSVLAQVRRNWSVPVGADCHRKVLVRILIATDASVSKVDFMKPLKPDDPECRRVEESLRQAILAASPLKFPAGKLPPSFDWLGFEPETWAEQ